MNFEAHPRPSHAERDAIASALARLLKGEQRVVTPDRSAWWRTGVAENVQDPRE